MSGPLHGYRAAVLTVSDRAHAGDRIDESGPAAAEMLASWGLVVTEVAVVPDERDAITARLAAWADADRLALVVTTGGTGFAPRDVTPEATRAVLDREAPGLAEMLRRETAANTRYAALSRGVAGVRGGTVIVNLPGSPKGVREYLALLAPVLPHAVKLAAGEAPGH